MSIARRVLRHLVDYRGHIGGFCHDARQLLLGQTLYATGLAVYGVFFNVYLKKGGLGEDFIGALASITVFASVLVGLPAGVFASRIGLRRTLLVSLPLISFTCALQSLTVDRGVLIGLAIVLGVGQMLFGAALYPLLTTTSDANDRHYVFSLSWALMSLTSVVGALVGGLVPHVLSIVFGLSEFHALRVALVAFAVLACASLLPARRISADTRRTAPSTFRQLMAHRGDLQRAWKFATLNAVIGLGAGFTIPFLSLYFSTVFNLGPSTIGTLFAVSGGVTGLAVLVSPLLVRRFGALYAMIIPQAVSIPFLILLAHSKLVWISVAAFWIRGALMNAATPVMNQMVMEGASEENRPIVNNLMSLSWNIGWSLTVALSGVIIKRHGYMIPFYATILVYIAYIVLLHRFFHDDETMGRRAPAPPGATVIS